MGMGAAKVRDLLNRPMRRHHVSYLLMRSIPSAKNDGSGMGGGNDEREQTLNQLLTEMDGI